MLGLQIDPGRSILVPTAHDEPPIHLGIYKDVFRLPKGIGYLTEVERKFVTDTFERNAVDRRDRRMRRRSCRRIMPIRASRPAEDGRRRCRADRRGRRRRDPTTAACGNRFQSHVSARGASFRRRHRIHGPFALYGGRIDPGKGCEELIEYFSTYVQDGGDASLVLMGRN